MVTVLRLVLAFSLGVAGALPAQEVASGPMVLQRLPGPVVVDGRLDESAWQRVAPLPLTVFRPVFRSVPTESTVIRIAYDDEALYVAFDCRELHPGMVRASSMVRDDDAPGDFVNLLLDMFHDGQSAVIFSTTPGGGRIDWAVSDDFRTEADKSQAWNTSWDVVTSRDGDGWRAEFRIPFASLRFEVRDDRVTFGLSANRLTAHSGERVVFPAIAPDENGAQFKPSRAQAVVLDAVRRGRGLVAIPYVLAGRSLRNLPAAGAIDRVGAGRLDGGLDVKIAPSAGFTLDATLNTDFAETESDEQRINLTRFPLFFAEHRRFFVERSGTFDLRTGDADLLFHSRRIGLTETGETLRLLGGARLVGRSGGWDIGALDVQTEGARGRPTRNQGVIRVRRRLLNDQTYLGAGVTSVLDGRDDQAVVAADGQLRFARYGYLHGAIGMVAGRTTDPAAGEPAGWSRGTATLVFEQRRTSGLALLAGASYTGAQYAPALGHVERPNALRTDLSVSRDWMLIPAAGIRMRLTGSGRDILRATTGTRELQTLNAQVAVIEEAIGTVTLDVTRQFDLLRDTLRIIGDAVVPPGSYTAPSVRLAYAPAPGPRLAFGVAARFGAFFDGTLTSLVASPEWRASAHLRLGTDLQLDRLAFPARATSTSLIVRVRALMSASPRFSTSVIAQVNSSARVTVAQVRARYEFAEAQDLWIVFGHEGNLYRRWSSPTRPLTSLASLTVKYTHRLTM